jgi:enoyl-CoA hydratase
MRDEFSSAMVLETLGEIAIIRLTQPSTRNALSRTTLDLLETKIKLVCDSPSYRGLIITGTGHSFAAGADIRELASLDREAAAEFARRGQSIFQKIAQSQLLTIAAINGYCIGGGLDLALACSLRYSRPDAVFAHPGAKLGIITGWGGTQRLPALIGLNAALDILLTARRVSAVEAAELGLVDAVVQDPVEYSIQKILSTISNALSDRSE